MLFLFSENYFMKKLISFISMFFLLGTYAVQADNHASNELVETKFTEFRTATENAKSMSAKSSIRFSVTSTEGFEISGRIGSYANADEQEAGNPKAYETVDFEITVNAPDEDIEKNKIMGAAEFRVVNDVVYVYIESFTTEGLPLSLFINNELTSQFVGRWIKIDLSSEALLGADFEEIQSSFDPEASTVKQISDVTGISEATLERMLQKFFDYDVLEFHKDPIDYKGYASYTAKLNKTNAFAYFNSIGEMIAKEKNSPLSLSDIFEIRKFFVKNKSLSLKVLIDEAKDAMAGIVLHFATQFNDGGERVDISIVSEMLFEHNVFHTIEAPQNAIAIEELLEEMFGFDPLDFEEPLYYDEEDYTYEYEDNFINETEEERHEDTYESSDAHIGDAFAPVTIVQFVDYECPFCKRFSEEVLPQIKEQYIDNGRVKFVFREFPLTSHQLAQSSATAAQCALQQGKYYEMHNALYNRKPVQDSRELIKIAVNTGLNETLFRDCMNDKDIAKAIEKDKADGEALGVTGIPSFFVNGKMVVGFHDYDYFSDLIEQELDGEFNEFAIEDERTTSAEEEDRFYNVMAETVCFMKDFTDKKLAPGVRPTQSRIKEIMDQYSPYNNDEIYNAVDAIAKRYGFDGYEEIEIIGGIYEPTKERTDIVEQRIFDTCFLEYDFD